jgi:Predicted transcriptional regulator with an HTH domain
MDVSAFRNELIAYFEDSGISQNELSKLAGVPQSQLSSWINGSGKRFGRNSRKVMRVIDNYRKSDEAPIPENVADAVRQFCRGSKERSDILEKAIRSLQPLTENG